MQFFVIIIPFLCHNFEFYLHFKTRPMQNELLSVSKQQLCVPVLNK